MIRSSNKLTDPSISSVTLNLDHDSLDRDWAHIVLHKTLHGVFKLVKNDVIHEELWVGSSLRFIFSGRLPRKERIISDIFDYRNLTRLARSAPDYEPQKKHTQAVVTSMETWKKMVGKKRKKKKKKEHIELWSFTAIRV